MQRPLTISIDAMGGDFGPSVIVPGAALALQRASDFTFSVIFYGDEAEINAALAAHPALAAVSQVRNAAQVIGPEDKPAQAVRKAKDSSMGMAIAAVKSGEADVIVSGGNTGALMALSKLSLRMSAKGLDRPAIVANWPTRNGRSAVLDVGANLTSDARQLLEFAVMGSAFQRAVNQTENPSVGLLNIGSEESKGHENLREAHTILKEGNFGLNYYGFVEGDDISKGTVDVVVTDGFTGNVALKTAEGLASLVLGLLREGLTLNLRTKIGALLVRSGLQLLKRFDPAANNGGPLLGLNGLVIKSHGGSKPDGFANAILVGARLARSGYLSEVTHNLERLSALFDDLPKASGT